MVDREDGTQERPSPKSKSISAENNNLLKKTAPKNITTRPNSDSSTDFEVSAEMSLEAKKNPSIGKQNPLADDKKDNISSPSAVESVDYSKNSARNSIGKTLYKITSRWRGFSRKACREGKCAVKKSSC